MCSFYGTKTAGQQHGGWRELRDSQMAYCVRNLLWKIAMEKTCRHIWGNDIKFDIRQIVFFYIAVLVLLNIQTSVFHKSS